MSHKEAAKRSEKPQNSPQSRKVGGASSSSTKSTSSHPLKSKTLDTKSSCTFSHKRESNDLVHTSQSGTSCHGDHEPVKGAAVSRLERELADLKKENSKLRKELAETKSLHEQLILELPEENFTEKRVNLLKSQLAQLERQVLLLSQALDSRGELLTDLFTMMEWLEDRERCASKDSSSASKDDLMQKTTSMKLRLSKYSQVSSLSNLAQPVRFLNEFTKTHSRVRSSVGGATAGARPNLPISLIDVCRGSLDHINMKHVTGLESKLAELFGQLMQLQSSLKTAPPSINKTGHLFRPIGEHSCEHVTKSCKLIGECCHDLMCLSLLVPTVPWPSLNGSEVSFSVSASDILKGMPTNVRNKKEVKESIDAAVCAFHYSTDLQERKSRSLEKELQFHNSVYGLQVEYVDLLFKAVRNGYEEFENSIQDLICTPVEGLLASYDSLSQTTSEEALRDFLSLIKNIYPQLKDAVRNMRRKANPVNPQPSAGVSALSLFGQQFFQRLHELESECFKQRQENFARKTDAT